MFWPPVRGDDKNQTERWNIPGVTSANSDQGRLFADWDDTTLYLYKDRGLAVGDRVASVAHLQPSSWTKLALTEANTSGITAATVYFKYDSADTIEVYPLLCTDAELDVALPGFDRFPKQSGQTTFENQLRKTREDLVSKLLMTQPPLAGGRPSLASAAGNDAGTIWRVNSVGDFEVRRLHNVWGYRNWAIWYAIAMIMRQNRPILKEADQLFMIEDADTRAEAAFAEAQVLIDAGEDLDADVEVHRYTIERG